MFPRMLHKAILVLVYLATPLAVVGRGGEGSGALFGSLTGGGAGRLVRRIG